VLPLRLLLLLSPAQRGSHSRNVHDETVDFATVSKTGLGRVLYSSILISVQHTGATTSLTYGYPIHGIAANFKVERREGNLLL